MAEQRGEPTYPLYLGMYKDFALYLSRSGIVRATRDDEEVVFFEDTSVHAVRLAIDKIQQKEQEAQATRQRQQQNAPTVLVLRECNKENETVYTVLSGQLRGVVAGTYDRRVRVETAKGRSQLHTSHVAALVPVGDRRVETLTTLIAEYDYLRVQLRDAEQRIAAVCHTCPQFRYAQTYGRPLSKVDALDVEARMFTALQQLVLDCAAFTVEV